MKTILLREGEIRECVSLGDEAISAVEEAFSRLASGEATVPPVIGIEIPERRGELDIKTAYVHGLDSFAIKVASGFFENEKIGLPVSCGLMLVVSAKTGFPEAVLFDNGYLTQIRTGAAGAIAAKYLAPRHVTTVGVIGAGTQGRYQAIGLGKVRKFKRLLVYDVDPSKIRPYVAEMGEVLGVQVEGVEGVQTLVEESQLVVTTTPTRTPYLRAEWLHPCLHITAMGADMAEKRELCAGTLERADRVVCDLRSQCSVRGELHHALKDGRFSHEERIAELGQLTSGRVAGRSDEEEITVCDLTGVGVQDTAIALLAYHKLVARGYGMEMETQ